MNGANAGITSRIALSVAWLVLVALAAAALIDRMAAHDRSLARRAREDRAVALVRMTLAPGTALACLNIAVGDATQDACEQRVFATPESTAAAVAYTGAELQWLKDAAPLALKGDDALRARFAAIRRAVELDRFGFAGQVLSVRDNCTPDKCSTFALLSDTSVLQANMKVQVCNQYVSRYAGTWSAGTSRAAAPPVAAVAPKPPSAPAPAATANAAEPPPSHNPIPSKYWLPSADTIPPVSIMNPEPPRPKSAEAQAKPQAPVAAAAAPIPPKRPRAEEAKPPPPH
jgi:hypothetical protein